LNRASVLVLMVLSLVLVGTIGFEAIEGWGWFKSFYATLMTIATIGADPLNQLSPAGQKFNAVMIVCGVAVVGFAIGSLTQAMVEFELGSFFGKRRMEKEIAKMHNHFIICGAGRVGRRIAQEIISREMPLLIIERDPARVQWARDHGIPVVIGDASSEEILREAHLTQARGLASVVTSDAQNVYIVLTARGLAPDLYIISRASEEDAESKLKRAGASAVISPYHYAGASMARMMTRPNVQSFLDVALSSFSEGGLNLQLEEIRVGPRSNLAGHTLGQASIREKLGIMVLAIRKGKGGLEFNPGPEHTIATGDFLIAFGEKSKLRELENMSAAD
jgi:voltage-gated potassium channel